MHNQCHTKWNHARKNEEAVECGDIHARWISLQIFRKCKFSESCSTYFPSINLWKSTSPSVVWKSQGARFQVAPFFLDECRQLTRSAITLNFSLISLQLVSLGITLNKCVVFSLLWYVAMGGKVTLHWPCRTLCILIRPADWTISLRFAEGKSIHTMAGNIIFAPVSLYRGRKDWNEKLMQAQTFLHSITLNRTMCMNYSELFYLCYL